MKITLVQTGGTIDKDYPKGETNHGYEFHVALYGAVVPWDKFNQ